MVEAGEAEVGEGQLAQHVDGVGDRDPPRRYGLEQLLQGGFVHVTILTTVQTPAPLPGLLEGARIGYLGPRGTFHEAALRSQPDLATADLVPFPSIPDIIAATAAREVELGLVAIENAIEGTVGVTADALAFEVDLLIQREVVLDVRLALMAVPGTQLSDVHTVVSFPHALGQCRRFLRERMPAVATEAAPSTAEAARMVGEKRPPGVAALGPSLAAELYDLDVLEPTVEDHPNNSTRFYLVAPEGVPTPSGHDKTSVVVYQKADVPGSLVSILQEFSARRINLTRLESRPTRRELGDYCFILDAEGHIADEVIADCLRNLKMKQADVKFLGSYPAGGLGAEDRRSEAAGALQGAQSWLDGLRGAVRPAASYEPL
ncbi:MAG: prephenate dehydratase [Acidimicrobiia bacterium]|nr:prephenate dehydratase [Acidimicrobiia bacterium]